jgi:tetratricopeptide (TPR) repeat protein
LAVRDEKDVALRPIAQRKAKPRRKPTRQPVRYPIAIGALSVAWLLILWWCISYVVADARFLQASQLLNQGKLDEAQHQYDLAVGFHADPQYGRIFGFTLGGFLVQAGKVAAPVFPSVTSAFGYLQRTPDEAGLVEYGDILNGWAAVDPSARVKAAELYSQAMELDRVNPQIRVAAAPIYIALQRYQDAVDALRPVSDAIVSRFPSTWGLRALAEANLGNFTAAREDAIQALALVPKDPNALGALKIVRNASG